jgi:hypothetical protein
MVNAPTVKTAQCHTCTYTSRRLWTFPWLDFGNRRRSAVFDGIWARLLRWKARESGIKKKILNKETFIITQHYLDTGYSSYFPFKNHV